MMAFLKWDERELYEKWVMAVLAIGLVLISLWFVLISPVLNSKSEAKSLSETALRDHRIVTRALPQIGQGTVATGQPFSRAVLIEVARKKSVRLSRVQPDGESVNVWVDEVPTGQLYGLINSLVTENGAQVNRATITASESGLLSAQLTLK